MTEKISQQVARFNELTAAKKAGTWLIALFGSVPALALGYVAIKLGQPAVLCTEPFIAGIVTSIALGYRKSVDESIKQTGIEIVEGEIREVEPAKQIDIHI